MKLNNILEREYEQVEEKKIEELNCNNARTEELDILIKLYETWLQNTERWENYSNYYSDAIDLFCKAPLTDISDLTLKDITLFSLGLEHYESNVHFEATGFFISAVINYHHEQTKTKGIYTLFTKDLTKKVDGIGYHNSANIEIIGDVGNRIAWYMDGGRLSIKGNVLSFCCKNLRNGTVIIEGNASRRFCLNMSGGNVFLKGSAEDFACEDMEAGIVVIEKNVLDKACRGMRGGNVTIKGNAGEEFAEEMQSGTIYLGGDYESLGENSNGRIKGI